MDRDMGVNEFEGINMEELGWERWFAWFPVITINGKWKWLSFIERKITGFSHPTDGWRVVSYR